MQCCFFCRAHAAAVSSRRRPLCGRHARRSAPWGDRVWLTRAEVKSACARVQVPLRLAALLPQETLEGDRTPLVAVHDFVWFLLDCPQWAAAREDARRREEEKARVRKAAEEKLHAAVADALKGDEERTARVMQSTLAQAFVRGDRKPSEMSLLRDVLVDDVLGVDEGQGRFARRWRSAVRAMHPLIAVPKGERPHALAMRRMRAVRAFRMPLKTAVAELRDVSLRMQVFDAAKSGLAAGADAYVDAQYLHDFYDRGHRSARVIVERANILQREHESFKSQMANLTDDERAELDGRVAWDEDGEWEERLRLARETVHRRAVVEQRLALLSDAARRDVDMSLVDTFIVGINPAPLDDIIPLRGVKRRVGDV